MTAKTTAERQRDLRKARLSEGLTEVRGIYAARDDHATIKAYAAKINKRRAKPAVKKATASQAK